MQLKQNLRTLIAGAVAVIGAAIVSNMIGRIALFILPVSQEFPKDLFTTTAVGFLTTLGLFIVYFLFLAIGTMLGY